MDPLTDAQFQVEVAVLTSLIAHARSALNATRIGLVGHSYGAYLSVQAAATNPSTVDALVLTGFSGTLAYFAPFLAGVSPRVAALQNSRRWGDLPAGYLTSADLFAETYAYFASPWFEHRVAAWSQSIAAEPFAVAELPTLLAAGVQYGNVTAPTLVLQGRGDVSACGGDCVGLLDGLGANFTGVEVLETVDNLPAG